MDVFFVSVSVTKSFELDILRTLIHEHYKIDDMYVLLTIEEQDIISYIESSYTNNSTIKSKLCSVYKAYKSLEIEGNLFKQRIDF